MMPQVSSVRPGDIAAVLPWIEGMELVGEPGSTASTFVGGPKHAPIRYRLRTGTSLKAKHRNKGGQSWMLNLQRYQS